MNAKEYNFKLSDGTNYFIKGNIDYDIVSDYLMNQLGYSIDKVISNNRYLILKISKDSVNYIFKMSSSEGINNTLLNEYSFNMLVSNNEYISVPHVYDQGNIEGLEYIITNFFEGKKLSSILSKVNGLVIENLVKTALYIDSYTGKYTYRNEIEDREGEVYEKVSSKADKYIEVSKRFISEVDKKYKLEPLLSILENYRDMDKIGFCHNEFDPENIIINNSNIYLFHGERASGRSPKYFDIAVMYEKLYCSYSLPNVANLFLRIFMDNISKNDIEYVKMAIKTMITSRLIGGYWEYSTGFKKDINMLEELRIKILNNELI